MIEQIAIYGAGDHGRLVAWTVEAMNEDEPRYELVGFIDDARHLHGQYLNDIPIVDFESAINSYGKISVVAGIGDPRTRQRVMSKVAKAGMESTILIFPNTQRTRWVEIGVGTIIGAGCIISSNVKIGKHVIVNLDCTIGHDAQIEDFVTISPGTHLAGNVHIGKRAFLGLGVVAIGGTKEEPLLIGDDVIIGAAACVTRSVPAGTTVAGVPAKPISRTKENEQSKLY